tara:strand:- start:119 stop:703 length:585 start_codon:yes stop_codon:yes gene_type:complete
MKKKKFINEDLKSLQDLQEKYQMKKKDIFDRLISDDINDKETVVKELDEIENDLDEIKKQISQLKELEEKEIRSNSVYTFLKYNMFNYGGFIESLKPIAEKYFESIVYEDHSDEAENYKSIYGYFGEKNENYFRFTEDNNGSACIDIKLNNIKQIASVNTNGSLEEIKTQLKNIFLDLSNKKLGVYHNCYYTED